MDNYDRNQVDVDLMNKVDDILTGKTKYEELPELVFSEKVPDDYDISQDINLGLNETISAADDIANAEFRPEVEIPEAGFNYEAPQAPDFGSQVTPAQQTEQGGGKSRIGMIIGIVAIVILAIVIIKLF